MIRALHVTCQRINRTKGREGKGRGKERKRIFYAVFNPIAPLAQAVVFQVQELEAGLQVGDELADLERARVVAERHGVDG